MIASRKGGTEESLKLIWKRVAYATRYGRAGLHEALTLDQESLQGFLDAVGDLVEQENRAGSGGLSER